MNKKKSDKIRAFIFSGFLFATLPVIAQTWQSQWVHQDTLDHSLRYKQDSLGNQIPDFSMVGYHAGEKAFPVLEAAITLTPSGKDDAVALQAAIDRISSFTPDADGIRGKLLLKKGHYTVSRTIAVQASGVIIAGEGDGADGTVITYTASKQSNLFSVKGKGDRKVTSAKITITDNYVPCGAKVLHLENTKQLKVGDKIIVFRPGTKQWIHAIGMDDIKKLPPAGKNWEPEEYDLYFERVITAKNDADNAITIDAPVVMPLDKKFGGGSVFKYSYEGRINEVGFEKLRMESAFTSPVDEAHGWNAINFSAAENCWVSQVTSVYFGYSCVSVAPSCKNISVLQSSCLDPVSRIEGGRRYSFNIGGQLILVKDCYARNGRHDFVTGARVCGPNAFVNCKADLVHADSGPHHRWATGILYDHIVTNGQLNLRDRGPSGTGHGWAGAFHVFWNCQATGFVFKQALHTISWNIGYKGKKARTILENRPEGIWEGADECGQLIPQSLYEAQLREKRKHTTFHAKALLDYCAKQALKTIPLIPAADSFPKSVPNGRQDWRFANVRDWTSGFWPGILWYLYEYTGNQQFLAGAEQYSEKLKVLLNKPAAHHDWGFMFGSSMGNGYRLTKNAQYKQWLLAAADSVSKLFNPVAGTMLSWPSRVISMNWPHNTIIDNMINLELLFWAAKNGSHKQLYDMAVTHAQTTMEHHFRKDYSTYHVAVYDTITGRFKRGVTSQGYADNSMWARGQAWAIYGFTMCYRETKKPRFLETAIHAANIYLKRLPDDYIPYWDFDDPDIPRAPKDASAAAIVAAALPELAGYVKDQKLSDRYREAARCMLATLSSNDYLSRMDNTAFLLHATGHKPKNGEIDASIIYGDYYYLEALMK